MLLLEEKIIFIFYLKFRVLIFVLRKKKPLIDRVNIISRITAQYI